MNNQLTEKDIKKMEEEIEYRKLVVRKEAIEAVKEVIIIISVLKDFFPIFVYSFLKEKMHDKCLDFFMHRYSIT